MFDLEHTATYPEIDAAGRLRAALWDRVEAKLDVRPTSSTSLVRVEMPLDPRLAPLDWLHAQSYADAAYWSGRDDEGVVVAAAGAADVLASDVVPVDFESLDRHLSAYLTGGPSSVRYYGGLRFEAGAEITADHSWRPFCTYRFVLPRFELVTRSEETRLACNLVLPRDVEQRDALADAVEALVFPAVPSMEPLPRPLHRTDAPERADWVRMVDWALDAIAQGLLDKVVLARRVLLDFERTLDPLGILRHLECATPGCYHFAIRPGGGPTFLGASPERLFRRSRSIVETEAVAGTRSRGESAQADAVLRTELFESEKDRREHAYVQDAIRNRLRACCTTVRQQGETSELKLARGRHLRSWLTGTLREEISTIDVLRMLHPTPAVGGVPTGKALAGIRAREPFDRGWYAGPVGWVGPDTAEFAVGIRSGLVRDDQLALFSGAGIVEGSDPEREWSEIEQKIGDFAAVLGLTD